LLATQRGLAIAVLALAIGSFCLASVLPVYTDEITWSAILGRLNYDHGKSLTITLQPTCEGVYATRVATVMWWPRWVNTYLADLLDTPLRIRLWGMLVAFSWIAITWQLLRRIFSGGNRYLLASVVAWSTLGVMPFLLVLNRPEQVLLLGTTVFLLLGYKPPQAPRHVVGKVAVAVAILLGTWYVLAVHPRGLFVAPLTMVFAYRVTSGKALRWGLMAALGVLTMSILRAWQPLWGCSQDPSFARLLAFSNFATAHALGMDRAFLKTQALWLMQTKGWFLKEFTPKDDYSSGMIPAFALPHVRLLRDAMEAVCLALLLSGILHTILCLREWIKRPHDTSRLLLALSGWLIYFLNVLVRVEKNEYEAAYMQPLMGLLIVCSAHLFWSSYRDGRRPAGTTTRRMLMAAQVVVMLLSVVSQCALFVTYSKPARTTWSHGGQPAGQKFSVSTVGYSTIATRVRNVAAQCSIDPAKPQSHLIVDESSYFVFRKSEEPMFAAYFDDRGWGYYRPDPTRLFQSLHSTGLITYCNRVPSIYAKRTHGDGELCCLPAF
jgi:hypothetical protein